MRISDLKFMGVEVGGVRTPFNPLPDESFVIPAWVPPVGSEPFRYEDETIAITGHATVCEVAPCVFVFAVYSAERLGVTRVRVTLKEDSDSIPRIRKRCIAPTAEDMALVAESA